MSGTLTLGGTAVTNGQIVFVADLPSLAYTPAADGNGQNFDSFEFFVRDSRGTPSDSPNTFTFHVNPVNDAPTVGGFVETRLADLTPCLLYTSPSPRDGLLSRMPSSA